MKIKNYLILNFLGTSVNIYNPLFKLKYERLNLLGVVSNNKIAYDLYKDFDKNLSEKQLFYNYLEKNYNNNNTDNKLIIKENPIRQT